MKMADLCTGEFASCWSLADFYPEAEQNLKELIASGEDFVTNFGCKKEIRYCTYTRHGDVLSICLTAQMDDLWESDDLIYDAIWQAYHTVNDFPSEYIESIRGAAMEEGLDDFTTVRGEVRGNITYEAVIEETQRLEDEAEQKNTEMFERLVQIVKEPYDERLWDAATEGFEADLDMGFDPYLGCYTDDV